MKRFLGKLQLLTLISPKGTKPVFKPHGIVSGTGSCEDVKEAEDKMKELWRRTFPDDMLNFKDAKYVGSVIVYDEDITIYEIMERAANDNTRRYVESVYNEAIDVDV